MTCALACRSTRSRACTACHAAASALTRRSRRSAQSVGTPDEIAPAVIGLVLSRLPKLKKAAQVPDAVDAQLLKVGPDHTALWPGLRVRRAKTELLGMIVEELLGVLLAIVLGLISPNR
eukprot:4200586-Pleurochrysis_carterae.AAC.2